MKYPPFAAVLPAALLLSACNTVEPALEDTGARLSSCVGVAPTAWRSSLRFARAAARKRRTRRAAAGKVPPLSQ